MTEQTHNALAQLAAGAQDPAVYALALEACVMGLENPASSACAQISPRGWARLDPDNAEPWVLLAARARQANDATAEADAFAQAAKANRVESSGYSLYSYAEPLLPSDTTPLERWYFAIQVFGIESALPHQQGH